MASAGDNEKIFAQTVINRIGPTLNGKKVFPYENGKVSISVDNSLVGSDTEILFEIDSGNMAKLLVGQYMLLNILHENSKNTIFVVVHYYKGYNSIRTFNNLQLINEEIYKGLGMPFVVFNRLEFESLVNTCENKQEFIKKVKDKIQ